MVQLLITVEEAAKRLSIGRSHMYALMGQGQILSVKLGRNRRIPVKALEEYADAKIGEAKGGKDNEG